jgi:hypothetical protein
VTVVDVPPARRGGPADIVYVLALLQVAFLMLAAIAEALLMGGNGAYLVVPVAKIVLLLWIGAKIVSGRRWAMITMIVVQSITLAGFGLQLLLAFVPAIGLTVNFVGVTTNLALPIAVIILCRRALPVRPKAASLPPPQDPYAPAPIVDDASTVLLP